MTANGDASTRIDLAREAQFALGAMQVRPASCEVVIAGKAQALQPRVMQVLVALARQRGEVVSRDNLVASCWEGLSVSDDAISRCIGALRRLSEHTQAFTVETIPRVGYRLAASASPGKPQSIIASPAKPRIAILPFENLSPDPANAFFADGLHAEVLTTMVNRAPGLEVISRTTMMAYKNRSATVQQLARDLNCLYVLEGSVRREGDEVRLTLQLINVRDDRHVWAENYDRTLTKALTLQSEVAKEVAAQLSVQLRGGAQAAGAPTRDPEAYDLYLKARLAREFLNGYAPLWDWMHVTNLLTRALERDAQFTLAYVERFGAYFWLHMQYSDTDGKYGRLAKSDLEAAQRFAPGDAAILGCEAQWAFAEQDFKRSLDLYAQAERAGLADPNILSWKATLHGYVGNFDEGLATLERLVSLDPSNLGLLIVAGLSLESAHRPAEALKVLDLATARAPDSKSLQLLLQLQRPFLTYMYTGSSDSLAAFMPLRKALGEVFAPDNPITLWFAHRFVEARNELDHMDVRELRFPIFVCLPVFGIAGAPVEWLRGQFDLQLGDRAAAKKDGKAVLAYVARQTETKWNTWFLRYLTAEGRLFQGDMAGALQAAHEALASSPDGGTGIWPVVPCIVAPVLALAGAKDEAVALLERLSIASPGLAPAVIARDPALTGPLADNPRYQALTARLEAQMAINKRELDALTSEQSSMRQ